MMATGPAASKEAAIAEIDRPERAGYARVLDFVNAFAPDPKTVNDATIAILLAGLASTPAECDRYRETLRRIVEGIKVPETKAESGFLSTAVQKAAPMVTALTTYVRNAPPIVKCVRVGKSYPGKVFRLSEISFEARLQTIMAVVGRNGSGKTTLFNIIAGQKQHNEGQVYFPGLGMNGTELDWRELHLRIAYVPQELPRWRGSLRDNIQYEAALHGLIGNENARETAFMIERLGLGDFVGHSWGELSGGTSCGSP
jgi:ABC-type multidrug transport system fused ATPase/permease subunit